MKKYTKRQKDWCKNYQDTTTFEPMMGDFEEGNETFQKAARRNVLWFESWSSDALNKCDKYQLSIDI